MHVPPVLNSIIRVGTYP